MSFPSPGVRAAGSTSARTTNPSSAGETSTPPGPSPSLWPEPAHPIPISTSAAADAHRAYLNPPSAMSNPGTASASGGHSNTTQAASGSTPPTSNSTSESPARSPAGLTPSSTTSSPPPRPIDITSPNIFESHYPRWHSYPHLLPTRFDNKSCPSPLKGSSLDPTGKFLQQSSAFQAWVDKKNVERIQLRHTPAYANLMQQLQYHQDIAEHNPNPKVRANAIVQTVEIKKAMAEERKKIAPAELQCIREIEKGWAAFVSMDDYEQSMARQRHLSTIPQAEPKSSLSKVERLLGSDGSCLSISSWTQRCQSIPRKVSCEETGVESMDLGNQNSQRLPPNPTDKLQMAGEGITPWPNNPYEILIPDWFHVVTVQGKLKMEGRTTEECYISLLNVISQLELEKSQAKYNEEHPGVIVADVNWDKNWHLPDPGWRYEKHRRMGGWWKCPKGPKALPAENKCTICSNDEVPESKPEPEPIATAQLLDQVMKYIGEAMAVVAENDKKKVLELNSNKKSVGLVAPGPLVEESVKIWAHQENPLTTTEPDTIPLGTRQPWINYNPLRGLDGPTQRADTAQNYLEETATGNKEQTQAQPDDEDDDNKNKDNCKCVPEASPTKDDTLS
ncbi:hypothetical protein F4678DRAFT_81212 [Xylaria arbuscula]|nr:hypothetical protein F4678DRAFT_81212 [Xylaria arbuscula]